MLLVFERVAQRRQISARQLAHRIHCSTITVHVLSSMRRTLCQFVTAWCHLERDLNSESPWIVSNRPACAFDDACLVWQSKCTDNARHEGKRRRQETAIARFQKCIPKSNIEGQQCKDRGSSAAVACGSSDAHINPAVTFGAVETGQFAKFAPYVIAQLAGAFVGAILVWLHFLPHWKETENKDFKLLCFCTMPAIRNFIANLISEIIGTFVLVFVVGAIFSKAVAGSGLVPGLGAYLVAALVWGIGLSLGGPTGYAINPLETSGRGLHTRYCQSRTRGRQVGAMRSYQ